MSGKKKNRNKVKRTGTGSQASTTVQVGKSEGTLPEDSVEISNGHSTSELDNSAELNVSVGKEVTDVSGTFRNLCVHWSIVEKSRGLIWPSLFPYLRAPMVVYHVILRSIR